ncbi:MAG: hypothetical protein BGO39_08520 [Chloroflexi bacterium 54-19]|nr:MAG: hypothetical protein BGO39_08520 [Chloroflexi bacterium 54-19]
MARPAEFQAKQAISRKVTFMGLGSIQKSTNQAEKDEEIEPHTEVHNLLPGFVERVQDVIVLGLCIVLFLIMARALWDLGLGTVVNEQVNVRDLI